MLNYEARKNSMVQKTSKFNIEEQENTIMEGISFKETWDYEQGLKKKYKYINNMHFSSEKINLKKMQMCFYVLHFSYIINDHKFKRFVTCHMLIWFSFQHTLRLIKWYWRLKNEGTFSGKFGIYVRQTTIFKENIK